MKTIIGLDEKYDRKNEKRRVGRRNEEGLTKREQDKKDRIEKIKVFLSKGLNQSKIAQELGISRQAVSKLCKEIQYYFLSTEMGLYKYVVVGCVRQYYNGAFYYIRRFTDEEIYSITFYIAAILYWLPFSIQLLFNYIEKEFIIIQRTDYILSNFINLASTL